MAKVSIIIPVYNAEKYIRKALNSLIDQTLHDIEIICVDDGSTDHSPEILDEFADHDQRIRVIHQENHGQVNANKVGIRLASAQYIGFTDADDWAERDMYEKLFRAISQEQADIVKCGYYQETGSTCIPEPPHFAEGIYDKESMIKWIYPKMLGAGDFFTWGLSVYKWNALFKKDLLIRHLMGEDERIVQGEDIAVVIPYVLDADKMVILNDCLYHYRQTPDSLIKGSVDPELARTQFMALKDSLQKSIEEKMAIFDCREYLRKYLLFAMIPRAEMLYRGFDQLPYLFPYPDVKKGSDIILYCAGTYGQHLHRYLMKSDFCHVVAWADRNADELKKQGLPVIRPDEISSYDCNIIVVASSFARQRKEIQKYLTETYPDKQISVMNIDLVMSDETSRAFGIL